MPVQNCDVKIMLTSRYGTLTRASSALHVPYPQLVDTLAGRRRTSFILSAIAREFGFSDVELMAIFPPPVGARMQRSA